MPSQNHSAMKDLSCHFTVQTSITRLAVVPPDVVKRIILSLFGSERWLWAGLPITEINTTCHEWAEMYFSLLIFSRDFCLLLSLIFLAAPTAVFFLAIVIRQEGWNTQTRTRAHTQRKGSDQPAFLPCTLRAVWSSGTQAAGMLGLSKPRAWEEALIFLSMPLISTQLNEKETIFKHNQTYRLHNPLQKKSISLPTRFQRAALLTTTGSHPDKPMKPPTMAM